MPKITYREVEIIEVMEIISENHIYTKTFIEQNEGNIPVYSATIGQPFGFVNANEYYDLEVFCVVNYGDSGKTYRVTDEKFCIGRNICALYVKDKYKDFINLEYIRMVSEVEFIKRAKGTKQKNLNQRLVKSTTIKIPIKKSGEYDYKQQSEFVRKNQLIGEKIADIQSKINYIKDVEVNFLEDESNGVVRIDFNELFSMERGKVISKIFLNENPGEYPVYSTQLDQPFGFIDTYMYDGEYLIWNTDGLGGYIRYVNGKFSITNIVGILKLNDKYKDSINLEYIRRIIQPIFRENTKGREGVNGKNEYTKINSTMIKKLDIKVSLPSNKNGEIDIFSQNDIVKKHEKLDYIKQNIGLLGEELLNINVVID